MNWVGWKVSAKQRAVSRLVRARQRAWGSNTRFQNPLVLIPAPSWFLSSVSLGQHSNPYFCLGFWQLSSSTSLLVLLTISTCILTCSACWIIWLDQSYLFLLEETLSLFVYYLLLCFFFSGFMSFWILFLDYFNGRSSGIRKKWVHGVHGLPSRFKWKSPRYGTGWWLPLRMLCRPGETSTNKGCSIWATSRKVSVQLHLLPFPLNTDSRKPWRERELA